MSSHNHLLEAAKQHLKQVRKGMQRQRRVLDLQKVHEELPVSCPCSSALEPCCLCLPEPSPRERRALAAGMDVEREIGSMQRRLDRMLDSPHDHRLLASMDVKGFDPKEITVTVKDGKVKVLAEHVEEHNTARGKEYNYRKITKEVSLPPGVGEAEVTYALGADGFLRIRAAHKCCSCPLGGR